MNMHGVYSIGLSIACLVLVAPVWAAGSPAYGVLSRVWQFIDTPLLLALGLSCSFGSILALRNSIHVGGILSVIVSAPIVIFCLVQTLFLSVLVFIKLGLGID